MILCEDLLGVKNYTHIVEPDYEIPSDRQEEMDGSMHRLMQGEPLQYVIGSCEFFGRRFKVNPSVLIPRPETEILVQEAETELLAMERHVRVLDLCTGSGCIAWSVALDVKEAEVVAVDISDGALATAAAQFPEEKGPLFMKTDVLDTDQEFGHGMFDMILSNPPYVMEKERAQMRRNVLDYEPDLALFVPDDDPLLFYRAVAVWAGRCLKEGGTGLVEINEQLPEQTRDVFVQAGMKETEIISDLYGKSRIVKFRK